jgi:DNA transposition AAA+ family ATPase
MVSIDSNSYIHPDQEPIHTSNVTRFAEQVDLLRNREHDLPELGIVIGPSGTGKTTAAKLYFTADQKSLSTNSGCMMIRVMPHMTPRALLESISRQIDDVSRSATRYVALQRAHMTLEQSQVRLLALDEADNLQYEHLEVLRMLLRESPCSLILIGLPSLLPRIELETLRVLIEKSGCTVLLIGHPGLLARMNRSFQVDACAVDPSDARTNMEDA